MILSLLVLLTSPSHATDYYQQRANVGCRAVLVRMKQIAEPTAAQKKMIGALSSFKPAVGGAECPNGNNFFRAGSELHICHEGLGSPRDAAEVCLLAAAMSASPNNANKLVDEANLAMRRAASQESAPSESPGAD